MCHSCADKSWAVKANVDVVEFLIEHGEYPAFVKSEEKIRRIERRLARKLNRLFMGTQTRFFEILRDHGRLPGRDYERDTIINFVMGEVFDQMAREVANESLNAAEVGREITIEDLIFQGMRLDFTGFSDFVRDRLLNRHYEFSQDTFERIKGDFKKTLAEGYEEGLGIDDIAERLRDDFDNLRDHRLRLIARTEVQSAQNEGIHETMQEYGVSFKQWLTANDDRVRESHVELHGEVVRYDEEFSNGLMHPGDRSGPIKEWINCRCRERPYIPRRGEVIITTPYYP